VKGRYRAKLSYASRAPTPNGPRSVPLLHFSGNRVAQDLADQKADKRHPINSGPI
jgi:hypothetical protein